MQGKIGLALAGANMEVQAGLIIGAGEDLRIGAGSGAEVNDATGKVAAKLRSIGVVAVEERDTILRKRFNQFKLCAGDAGLAVGKVLNVRGADVGDDAPVGCGDSRQCGNFT